ncbi:MAG TPA: glycoside hydrolase family 9 protein [Longimicrobiales bacterium]
MQRTATPATRARIRARALARTLVGTSTLALALASAQAAAQQPPQKPMPLEVEYSAEFRWLNKPVLARRMLDDMSDPATWRFRGTGRLTPLRDAGPGGVPALRVDVDMYRDEPAPTRNGLSSVNLRRSFAGGDWSGYNRISLWIRPDVSGFPMLPLQIVLHNEGREKVPDAYYREGIHYVTLQNGRWQRVVWEIEPLPRDRVTAIEIGYWVNKMFADPGDRVAFEIAGLELERVEPDHYEGWNVAPGRIAYSHTGYALGGEKTALASGLAAREFELIRLGDDAPPRAGGPGAPRAAAALRTGAPTAPRADADTAPRAAAAGPLRTGAAAASRVGDPVAHHAAAPTAAAYQASSTEVNAPNVVVLRKPVRTVHTRLGEFQVLDFSEVRTPGRYVLRAGDVRTQPFRIDADVWRGTIWKAINFFFGERCGYAVPGSHGVDHADWLATHGDLRIVMNGGWHDAGDLSQGMVNTGEATYAMFALAERLQARGEDPVLLGRLLEEAKWGLDWVLRVRFPGGYRIGFASNNIWTNGIIGDADDRTREALNNPNVNYIAAAAAAIAYRVLKDREPELAARALRIAEDDWRYAIAGVEGPETWSTPAYRAMPIELAGIGITASLELWRATGGRQYAEKAVELARIIVESQQKSFIGTEHPLAGFFYTGPGSDTLFHQFHRGNDQAPIVALAQLVEAFPDHPDWMRWYATVARYAEYLKAGARTMAPYGVLPAYVYRDTDHLRMTADLARYQATPEAYRAQVLEGMPLGDGWYLRAFPVWFARRGNYGVLLSQAKALSAAAHLRGDLEAAELAETQAQWIVGRNPFTQSTMIGEGYDWAQQYSVSSGDIVGALPVGMQTRGARDVPYWPPSNMYVYKEVWVHPVTRWLWLMRDVAGPALLEGRAAPGTRTVELVETATSRAIALDAAADGAFRAFVPAGEYILRAAGFETRVALLPGGTHRVDLRPGRALDFSIDAETSASGDVTIRVTARGDGPHVFALRVENMDVDARERAVTLRPGAARTVEWKGRMIARDEPWVAVVVPDGDPAQRRDAVGALPRYRMAAAEEAQ